MLIITVTFFFYRRCYSFHPVSLVLLCSPRIKGVGAPSFCSLPTWWLVTCCSQPWSHSLLASVLPSVCLVCLCQYCRNAWMPTLRPSTKWKMESFGCCSRWCKLFLFVEGFLCLVYKTPKLFVTEQLNMNPNECSIHSLFAIHHFMIKASKQKSFVIGEVIG